MVGARSRARWVLALHITLGAKPGATAWGFVVVSRPIEGREAMLRRGALPAGGADG